jgi:hypothetical protein
MAAAMVIQLIIGAIIVYMTPFLNKEIYNLQHAQAHKAIERIFGILKRWFIILVHPPEYSMLTQARIPQALCVIHNFICIHDPTEIEEFANEDVVDCVRIYDPLRTDSNS